MQLFRLLAEKQEGEKVRIVPADMLAPSQLRKAAGMLAEGCRFGLALIPRGEGWSFALCSTAEDVRPAAQQLNQRFGGKAGGPRDMVQGVLASGSVAEMRALLEAFVP
ncbi:MAG: hypothetical protein IJ507_10495 [Clostridia bacterium]|nr:hypothetical protein [Clostridia bacterium]